MRIPTDKLVLLFHLKFKLKSFHKHLKPQIFRTISNRVVNCCILSYFFSVALDSKLDGFVRKQCTESFKVRAHSPPNFVTSKTTITMYKDTDEKVTTV